MSFYIDVSTAAGAIVGDGPITTASKWRYTARMDRAGDFSFTMPATDPAAANIQKKRIVRAMAFVGGAWVEVGAGIIDTIKRSPAADGITTLEVSGPDLLGELLYRSVLNLKIYFNNAPISHAAAVTAVAAFAPAGWTFTADPTPPNDLLYGRFNGETVLAALIKIGDKCQDHFYRSSGRTVTFASSFAASGIRAIAARQELAPETAAITELSEKIDTKDLITRIYPRGSGNGDVQLTLKATTRAAPAGYTLDANQNYIEATAAVASYGRIERQLDFREIGPIENTTADIRSAADMLFDAALEELKRRSTELEQATYTLSLAQCGALLRPMQSLIVDYHDPAAGLVVHTTLNILEATWQVDQSEVQTTGLVVSTADRWPSTDTGAVVDQMERGELYQALPQLNANSYVTAYNALVDQTQTAGFRFRFGNEVSQLQQVLFEFQLLPLESSVKSVGGSTSGSGSIPTTGPNTDTTGTGGNNTTGAGGSTATNAGGTAATDAGGTAASGSGGTAATGAGSGTVGAAGAVDTTANGSGNTNAGGSGSVNAGGTSATDTGGPAASGSAGAGSTGTTGAGATSLDGSGNTGTTGAGTTGTTGSGDTGSAGGGQTGSAVTGDTGTGGGGDTGGTSGTTSSDGGTATGGAEGGDADGSGNHRHSVNLVRGSFDSGWFTVYYDDFAHRFKVIDPSGGTFTSSTACLDAFGQHTHDTDSHTHSTSSHTHSVGSHTHSTSGHTHDIGNHTHSVGSHTHTIGSHTHTIGTHTHSVGSHTHDIGSHTHSITNHTHTLSTHTHSIDTHTHFVSNHTHAIADHTHSVGSHTHSISTHTHTIADHTHPISDHTHSIATHTHSMSQHTHTLNNHVHDLSESITALYGIFRESAANTFALVDLEYRVNSSAWAGLETSTSVSGSWRRLDITALVQDATTLRQNQDDNLLEIRRKTAGATAKTGQIDAQLSVRNVIQAVSYA